MLSNARPSVNVANASLKGESGNTRKVQGPAELRTYVLRTVFKTNFSVLNHANRETTASNRVVEFSKYDYALIKRWQRVERIYGCNDK